MWGRTGTVVLAVSWVCLALGCMTPLSAGRHHVALGLLESTPPDVAGVRTYGARGVGVLFRPGGVSLGVISYRELVVDPNGSPDGVYVTMPGITAATGAKAERIAASPEAAEAFLLSPAGPGAYGVLP